MWNSSLSRPDCTQKLDFVVWQANKGNFIVIVIIFPSSRGMACDLVIHHHIVLDLTLITIENQRFANFYCRERSMHLALSLYLIIFLSGNHFTQHKLEWTKKIFKLMPNFLIWGEFFKKRGLWTSIIKLMSEWERCWLVSLHWGVKKSWDRENKFYLQDSEHLWNPTTTHPCACPQAHPPIRRVLGVHNKHFTDFKCMRRWHFPNFFWLLIFDETNNCINKKVLSHTVPMDSTVLLLLR